MSTLYENIKFHCDRLGISGAKLCAEAEVSKSTLTSLKNGRTKKINTENLAKMASVLGVTVDTLLGSDQKEKNPAPTGVGLSEADLKHLRAFHAADEETKTAITMLLKKFEKGESL